MNVPKDGIVWVPSLDVNMTKPFRCRCNTTLLCVIEATVMLQPAFGHIYANQGSGGGPIMALAIIWPYLM
jgi:hypothetical protein